MKARPVIVAQDDEKPIPVEIMAECIKSISDGIKRLRSTRLNDKALYLLIQHAAPNYSRGRYGTKVPPSINDIRSVLEGIEGLEREYLKPTKPVK